MHGAGNTVRLPQSFLFAFASDWCPLVCDFSALFLRRCVSLYCNRTVLPDQSFIPRAAGSGDWDCCGVFGAKQSPEQFLHSLQSRRPGKPSPSTLPLFYAGCNGRFFGPRSCALGRAQVQTHSFAGYAGPGVVEVAPARVSTGELQVTASGGVRVGVQGSSELSANASTSVDGVEVGVTWAGTDLSKYAGGAVILVFEVPAHGVLYAYHM